LEELNTAVICKWQTSFSQQVQPSRSFELCVSVSGDLSVGVCNKEHLYALIDAETEIFLIYSLFLKKGRPQRDPSRQHTWIPIGQKGDPVPR
jgi:hypothetical protein